MFVTLSPFLTAIVVALVLVLMFSWFHVADGKMTKAAFVAGVVTALYFVGIVALLYLIGVKVPLP
jgi:hypothetical protein